MVGQRFGQVVAEVPAQTQSIRHDPHQLAFGADALEEEDELEFEEHDRIDRWAADPGLGVADQIPDEGEVERAL
jgi:hypothetical protein